MIKTITDALYTTRSTAIFLALLLASSHAYSQCPQYRKIAQAPSALFNQPNPLELTHQHLRAGKRVYKSRDVGCYKCHGKKGTGDGPLALSFAPPPRNFTCAETMASIPDGQLFWGIKHGVPNTAMPAHPALSDEQIWQLVLVLRGMVDKD
jgi:mono/diheme cytochrome c family protein